MRPKPSDVRSTGHDTLKHSSSSHFSDEPHPFAISSRPKVRSNIPLWQLPAAHSGRWHTAPLHTTSCRSFSTTVVLNERQKRPRKSLNYRYNYFDVPQPAEAMSPGKQAFQLARTTQSYFRQDRVSQNLLSYFTQSPKSGDRPGQKAQDSKRFQASLEAAKQAWAKAQLKKAEDAKALMETKNMQAMAPDLSEEDFPDYQVYSPVRRIRLRPRRSRTPDLSEEDFPYSKMHRRVRRIRLRLRPSRSSKLSEEDFPPSEVPYPFRLLRLEWSRTPELSEEEPPKPKPSPFRLHRLEWSRTPESSQEEPPKPKHPPERRPRLRRSRTPESSEEDPPASDGNTQMYIPVSQVITLQKPTEKSPPQNLDAVDGPKLTHSNQETAPSMVSVTDKPQNPDAGDGPKLTHLNEEGAPHMVSVTDKPHTRRVAIAAGRVHIQSGEAHRILKGQRDNPKGDPLNVARIAGIMAAKATPSIIPLCHPIGITHVDVQLELSSRQHVNIRARCETVGPTGVEMEALTAVSGACLGVIDMLKAVDKDMVMGGVHVVAKDGGKSGRWRKRGWEDFDVDRDWAAGFHAKK